MSAAVGNRRALLVLIVTMLGLLMVFSSTTSINVALPAIADALQPSAGVADWFLLSYMLASSVLILVFARVSDFLGRRTIYLVGVAVMTAASIACAFAPDTVFFIAMRALQGVGAAVVLTNVNALVADVYPEGRRSAALGLNVMCGSVAGALGPVAGGFLVSSLGWESVFLVNVPFGIAGLALGYFVLPRTAAAQGPERFDWAGALLSIITLFALLFAINRISAWGIGDLRVVLSFVVAVLALAAFAAVESRLTSPLIDLELITRGRRYFAYAAVFFISAPQTTLPVVIVLYEQLVLGRSPTSAGLVIIPFAVIVAITAPIAGRVVHRYPPHRLPIIGGLIMSAGLLCLLGYFGLGANAWLLFAGLVVAGFGNGLFHTPNIAVIMSGIPSNRFGVAGGVRSVLFNSSQSIGTAVVLLILGAWFTSAGGSGLSQRIADPAHVEPAFVIVTVVMIGCTLCCSLFSLLAARPSRRVLTSEPLPTSGPLLDRKPMTTTADTQTTAPRIEAAHAVRRIEAVSLRGPLPTGASLISLAAGEPDFASPAGVNEALVRAIGDGYTHYAPAHGDADLRTRIAREVEAISGHPHGVDNVLVTHGGTGGLATVILGLIDPGDRVVVPDPTYSLYADLIAMAGAEIVRAPVADDLHWDFDILAEALVGAKMFIFCNPGNPTGIVHSAEELHRLGELLQGTDTIVLSDEAYSELVYGESQFTSVLEVQGLVQRSIYCQTFSKKYAMTGWRLGYVTGPADMIAAASRIHGTISGPVNTAAQRAALVALDAVDSDVAMMVSSYAERRTLMLRGLAEIPQLTTPIPGGAFYAFPSYDFDMSSVALVAYLRKHGVAVRPGSEYGPTGEGRIRLSYSASPDDIIEGITRIKSALNQLT